MLSAILIHWFAWLLSFGKSSLNPFYTCSSRGSFSLRWAFCPYLWFFSFKKLLSAHYQTLLHFWRQKFYWLDTWTVYKDSPRVDKWNTTAAVFIAILQQSKYYDEANTVFWSPKRLKVFKQNLTPCNFSYFEIWHSVKFLNQNDAFWIAWKKYDFHGPKGTETWFFEGNFSENPVSWKTFISKSDALWKFHFKNWRVFFEFKIWQFVQFLSQKLAGTKILFKNWRVVKFLIQSWFFVRLQVLAWSSWRKGILGEVRNLSLHETWWSLFIECLFLFFWGLMMAVITISFSLPIHVIKLLWVAKFSTFTIKYFQKVLTCHYFHQNHLGKSLQFLYSTVHILFF